MDPSDSVKGQNDKGAPPQAVRPLANYHPDIWSDVFANYIPLDEVTQKEKEQEANELKEEVRKELLTDIKNPKERLVLIDAIQRLGVAYYFEEEIEDNLQHYFRNNNIGECYQDDLYYVSLRFRLLRQHGFCESCDVFEKFKDKNGSFKEWLSNDVEGILSLYEASHLRLHGENILDEALDFTKTHLTSLASRYSTPLADQITHALTRPIYKTSIRRESKFQISIYDSNASAAHEALLRLAKLDFNLLQLLHKKELSDLIRWSRSMDFTGKFPFARSRMVEPYVWTLGVYYEPKYSFARIILNKVFKLITVIDDMYDAYGFIEELELFTDAILRWNISCMNQLPDYMKLVYKIVLDTFQEFEQDLANEGMSYAVYHLREELKASCQAYLQEARWCHEKYVPKYDEYMKNAIVSCVYRFMLMATYQGMGKIATKEAIEWIRQNCKAVKATCIHARLLDDMAGHKFEQKRNHVASAVECYMANFNVSEEEAYKELQRQVEEAWKDVEAEMFRPTAVPMPLLTQILNMSRALYDAYEMGEDGFTVSKCMKPKIQELLIEPAV